MTTTLELTTNDTTTKPKRKPRRVKLTRREIAIIRSFPDVRWYDELLPSD